MIRTKNIAPVLVGLLLTIGAGVAIAHAQGYTYTPLAPLPGTITSGKTTTNISDYLAGMIKLLIALGAAMAILFAIIGGTQYVAASINPAAKKDAMDRIQNALIGLAIMLTSYLLLSSINPELVGFKLQLKGIPLASTPVGDLNKWPDDEAIRRELADHAIHLNKDNCVNYDIKPAQKSITGQSGCTSVAGLPRLAIDSLLALKYECGGLNCPITVTGGTEPGHQTHGVGEPNVDLNSKDSPILNAFIKNKAKTLEGGAKFKTDVAGCGRKDGDHYYITEGKTTNLFGSVGSFTGIYVLEDKGAGSEHWHVCFK